MANQVWVAERIGIPVSLRDIDDCLDERRASEADADQVDVWQADGGAEGLVPPRRNALLI